MYKVFHGSRFDWKEINSFERIQDARRYIQKEIANKENSFYTRIFPSEDFKSIFFDYGSWSLFYKIECEDPIDFSHFMSKE